MEIEPVEPESVIGEDRYPFADDMDQSLRCFIFENYANADIAGDVLIKNMGEIYKWIRDGQLPVPEKPKTKLATVKG